MGKMVYPHPLHRLPLTVAKSACNGCTRLFSPNDDGPVSAFLPLYILVNTNTIHLSALAPRWILVPTPARKLFGGAKIFLNSHSKKDRNERQTPVNPRDSYRKAMVHSGESPIV